jgi:hypothetical protein
MGGASWTMKHDDDKDRYDPAKLRAPEDLLKTARVGPTPTRIRKRQERFVQVPWWWIEKLQGSPGHTYHVAHFLLYLHWQRGDRGPITLASGMLAMDGVSPSTKVRALRRLEHLGLITVEWRLRKSPKVTLHLRQK